MLTEHFFDSDGVNLHYIDWGGSGTPVVLLAGLGGTAQLFRGLAPRLAERFRVAALTRRGHGRSDLPESGYEVTTSVEDIRRLFERLGIERAALVGHSWAGIEMTLFASTYPDAVEAVVYLDALNVLLEPVPDPATDPVWDLLETIPRREDLASREAYVAYLKRSRPDLASIWCEAVEADRLEYTSIKDGRLRIANHGREVTSKMHEGLGAHREPAYGDVKAPMLAVVPDGITHPFVPPDASKELELAANGYYVETLLPWIRRRTELFRQAAPGALVIELDTSNHTIFVARENDTAEAIIRFLEDEQSGGQPTR